MLYDFEQKIIHSISKVSNVSNSEFEFKYWNGKIDELIIITSNIQHHNHDNLKTSLIQLVSSYRTNTFFLLLLFNYLLNNPFIITSRALMPRHCEKSVEILSHFIIINIVKSLLANCIRRLEMPRSGIILPSLI